MDRIEDNSPIDQLDSRRFYMQTYSFTMLGFLIDDEEFEVKPAVSRMFLMNEFIKSANFQKKYINKTVSVLERNQKKGETVFYAEDLEMLKELIDSINK